MSDKEIKGSVLYLHGLDSSPLAAKTSIISEFGWTVIAPQMHYREENQLYLRVRLLTMNFNVSLIIGSSLGGYMAFWLSRALNVPCFLFNPALSFKNEDPGLVPTIIETFSPQTHIYLGMQDTVVDPLATKDWLKKHATGNVSIIEDKTGGHRIPLDVFQVQVAKVLS